MASELLGELESFHSLAPDQRKVSDDLIDWGNKGLDLTWMKNYRFFVRHYPNGGLQVVEEGVDD